MLRQTTYHSPLGKLILLGDQTHLQGLWFHDQKYCGGDVSLEEIPTAETPLLALTATWLTAYFAGENPSVLDVPLAPQVTEYRHFVLDALQEVPYGSLVTYGELHQQVVARVGRKVGSPRALGGAVGHNPVAILIPCHRVIGTSGQLTGYAGGLARKIALLRLEGIDVTAWT